VSRRPIRLLLALAVAAPALIGGARAQSLAEARARATEERRLSDEVAFTNRTCGTSIRGRIDWGRAGDWPSNRSLAQACDVALGALEAVCREPGGAEAAKSGVSSFTCAGDGSGVSLSGGRLRYGAGGRDGFGRVRAYLRDRLL